MDKKHTLRTETAKFWIQDYGNVWAPVRSIMGLAKIKEDLEPIKEYFLKTFQEYVKDKRYDGQKCDINIIPLRFIHQINKLVRIYNNLIAQEIINIEKLEKIVNLAHKTIYKY